MTQPEALRLADALETAEISYTSMVKAAAEMRRLHTENEALRKTLAASCDEERQQMWEAGPGGGCSRALSAEFQRDALLEALRLIAGLISHPEARQKALDAITKCGENT